MQVGMLLKQSDINFKTALKVLCFRESREQNEGAALLKIILNRSVVNVLSN